MERRNIIILALIIAFIIFVCVGCLAFFGAGAFFLERGIESGNIQVDDFVQASPTTGPTPEIIRDGDPPSFSTLETLENTIVPENNPVDLAERLLGIQDIPETFPAPQSDYNVGDRRDFWVTNTATDTTFETTAVLRYETDHLYFWIEEGVSYNQDELAALSETFENEIYPITRAFFGSEWTPGIDEDPHIYVLYTTNVGFTTAGYFSSADEIHPLAHEFSNAAEMFVLNADNSFLDEEYTYGVLAHEFQHMIHWNQDRNETSWMNEGLSELATLLNGFEHGGFGRLYTSSPDLQLNDWPVDQDATPPHYGAGFLFVTYFLEQFGDEATQALVANPDNGLDSVDGVMETLGIEDPQTGEALDADDVVRDWVTANYLLDSSFADGRYGYPQYGSIVSQARPTEFVNNCDGSEQARDVHQYGVDYIRINCEGSFTLHFEGSNQTQLLPEHPYSGDYAFWTNKGDESDMTLTQLFDFSGVEGPLTFSFWTWYDIEEDWDYVYLLTSTDGEDWEFVSTPNTTSTDPNGNNYGIAYTGFSGGDDGGVWIQESVDLSEFAGQEVYVRFEYVTDAALNGEGMLIDDVAIEEIGYFSDFEEDDGGWEAAGFARVENVLPQTFELALIYHGAETSVEVIRLNEDNSIDIELELGSDVEGATLVVMGSTRFTRQTAAYRFAISPQQ